jgi:hypothetical protein
MKITLTSIKSLLKGSDNGVLYLRLLPFWSSPITLYFKESTRFDSQVCSLPCFLSSALWCYCKLVTCNTNAWNM